MKKNRTHMPLLLAAGLLASALLLTACFGSGGKKPEETGKSAADQVAEYQGKNPWEEKDKEKNKEDAQSSAPAETDAADEKKTEAPTEKVTEPPKAPETEPVTERVTEPETEPVTEPETEPVTTEPAIEPKPVNPSGLPVIRTAFPAEGRITSTQSKNLVLNADYSAAENADGSIAVTVKISLSSYEIYAGVRKDSGMLKVNGEEVIFSTPELVNEDRVVMEFPFLTRSFTLPAGTGSVDISAMWLFNGTYGGTNISNLTLGASVQPE